MRDADRPRDLVRGDEADAEDVARQPVGVVLDDLDGVIAVGFVDLDGQAGGDAVALQEKHHLFDLLLFGPGAGDQIHPFAADAEHLVQALRFLFDDLQRFQPEFAHDAFGRHRADALDQPAAQVFLQAGDGGGQDRADRFSLELPAILGMRHPRAAQLDRLADIDAEHVADDRDRIARAVRRQLRDGVAVFFVVEGDAFDCAAQRFQHGRHRSLPLFYRTRAESTKGARELQSCQIVL